MHWPFTNVSFPGLVPQSRILSVSLHLPTANEKKKQIISRACSSQPTVQVVIVRMGSGVFGGGSVTAWFH